MKENTADISFYQVIILFKGPSQISDGYPECVRI